MACNGTATPTPANPLRRLIAWVIDCALLFIIGPVIGLALWTLSDASALPQPPICGLECLDKNIRAAILNPHADVMEISSNVANIVLNAAAWLRHLSNLALYVVSILSFVLTGLFAGAALYIIWWAAVLHRGQTPGKMLTRIRAVYRDGSRVEWRVMFIREGLKTMLYLIPFVAIFDGFVILSDIDESCSLADRFARTMIVRR